MILPERQRAQDAAIVPDQFGKASGGLRRIDDMIRIDSAAAQRRPPFRIRTEHFADSNALLVENRDAPDGGIDRLLGDDRGTAQ